MNIALTKRGLAVKNMLLEGWGVCSLLLFFPPLSDYSVIDVLSRFIQQIYSRTHSWKLNNESYYAS
jgi:hypothetical protein